jgi:hypothetical protein
MRILFVTVDYPDFLEATFGDRPGTENYADLLERRNSTLFSRADYVTDAVAGLGHSAEAFYINNLPLQLAWRREHLGSAFGGFSASATAKDLFFRLRRKGSSGRLALNRTFGDGSLRPQTAPIFDPRNPRIWSLLAEQIKSFRPDIVYSYDPVLINGHFLASLKPYFGALVGQIAAPYPANMDWSPFDLVLSSLPNYVERFTKDGIRSAYLPLYFAPQVLNAIGPQQRDIPLSFVGSVMRAHGARRRYLERMAEMLPIEIYGTLPGEEDGTPLGKAFRGPAWGRGMYTVLGRSRLTLNSHIDIAEGYANNLRLFEATGMGACLVTDKGRNLSDLFEPSREVLVYGDAEECVELCRYYTDHPNEAVAIAEAGQRRCLTDHTVQRNSERMVDLIRQHL